MGREVMADTLDGFLDAAWMHLVRGVKDRKHGFHQPVVATVDEDGPRARVVVLRNVDREEGTVICHTDRRSGKTQQAHGGAAWCFYDKSSRLQIRATGELEIVTEGELFEERWAASRLASRRCYLAPFTPGSELDEPHPNLPDELRERDPSEEESEAGRANFAVVLTTIFELDVLHLAHDGHQRARWQRGTSGWSGSWVAP